MRKVALITGITGQDGSFLAEFLLEKGYDVHGTIRRSSVDFRERIAHLEGHPAFHLHYADLGDSTSLSQVVKNKVAPPFREAEFDIMYGEGISHFGELLDLGVKLELVQKSGSWFSIGETRIGQGRDAAKRYLQENPETADKLEADIRRNFDKLMSNQSRIAAKAAGRAVDVSADDFEDAD